MVFPSLKKLRGIPVGCELRLVSTEINVKKATIRGMFDKPLHIDALKEQIPIRISFEYSIKESEKNLTFEKEELEAVISDGQKYLNCEVESEKDIERGKKFVTEIGQILEKYSELKMTTLELTDSTFQITLPIDYTFLLDKSEIKEVLSNDFAELTLDSLEFSVDEKYSFRIAPAQIYNLSERLREIMDKFVYRYIPISVGEEIINDITLSLGSRMERLKTELNLGSVYSLQIQGDNYEKTYEICKKIINKVPKAKREKVAKTIREYNALFLEYAYRDLDKGFEKYLPPNVRRRIRSYIQSDLHKLRQKKLE